MRDFANDDDDDDDDGGLSRGGNTRPQLLVPRRLDIPREKGL